MGIGKTQTSGLDVAYFWMRVHRTSSCWLWRGTADRKGYGHLTRGQQYTTAHRYSWLLINGAIPKGKWVLHKCDTPRCVRPSHLFLGDHIKNMRDMRIKKRKKGNNGGRVGELHGCAKLRCEDILTIRSSTLPQRVNAEAFGVSQANISAIVSRRTWRHI